MVIFPGGIDNTGFFSCRCQIVAEYKTSMILTIREFSLKYYGIF